MAMTRPYRPPARVNTAVPTESVNGNLQVHCPVCGCGNAHLTATGEQPMWFAGYGAAIDGVTVTNSDDGRQDQQLRDIRQGGIRIPVLCEANGHVYYLYVGEHKGTVYVWVADRRGSCCT